MRRSLVLFVGLVGCARDPVDAVCPPISEGDLVITEIRGPQKPDDLNGPWVELFNASSSAIDLEGIKIRFRRKDGSSEIDVLVRRGMPVSAGEYVVLGLFGDDDPNKPSFVDYGFQGDFNATWLSAAAVDVESCGLRVDRATYDVLPTTGTFSLGSMPPTADANDLSTSWCTDPASLGTPKAANIACP